MKIVILSASRFNLLFQNFLKFEFFLKHHKYLNKFYDQPLHLENLYLIFMTTIWYGFFKYHWIKVTEVIWASDSEVIFTHKIHFEAQLN